MTNTPARGPLTMFGVWVDVTRAGRRLTDTSGVVHHLSPSPAHPRWVPMDYTIMAATRGAAIRMLAQDFPTLAVHLVQLREQAEQQAAEPGGTE